MVVDPKTQKIVEFNDAAKAQSGYSSEELSKLRLSDFEAKETADEVNAHLAKMQKEEGDAFETKFRSKNGDVRSVLVNTKAVELGGKPLLFSVFNDITEPKSAKMS